MSILLKGLLGENVDLTNLNDILHECEFTEGSIIVSQLEKAKNLYFLIDGSISLSIKLKDEPEDLQVGLSSEKFTPIGWSGFKEPFRYATTVIAASNVKCIYFKFNDLNELFESNLVLGTLLLKSIVKKSLNLLFETRELLAQLVPISQQSFLQLSPYDSIGDEPILELEKVLKSSPFLAVFEEPDLMDLKKLGKLCHIKMGEKYFQQGNKSDELSFLVNGRLALIHARDEKKQKLDKRIVSEEGYVISVSGFSTSSVHFDTCVALQSSWVWSISLRELKQLLVANPTLSISFYKRLIWYVSVSLRSARARLIRVQYDGEISAVKHIIEQHAMQLDVLSEIHKVPTLLSHTVTLKDAIQLLKQLKASGNALEKRLSNGSLSILTEVLRENDFYSGLANIYSSIVNAPSLFSPKEVRNLCAESFCDLFQKIGYNLKGEENLPKEPAIYIYNHLENHVYNTLPNNFQLTLDSHFISSVILYKSFQNSGIRVVRVPKDEEYGHQHYYERLGHIQVYTQDSIELHESKEQKRERRNQFYATSAKYLNDGTSILLAPEGRSFKTDQSPGDFKAGAFILASKLPVEPLIVPIAVANFDKRLNRTRFSAVIKKPFKLSEKVKDVTDRSEMNQFLKDLKTSFKSYVKEASEMTDDNSWTKLL